MFDGADSGDDDEEEGDEEEEDDEGDEDETDGDGMSADEEEAVLVQARKPTKAPATAAAAPAKAKKTSAATGAVVTALGVAPEGQKRGRFILFIGNLPFDASREMVLRHFSCVGTGGIVGAWQRRLRAGREPIGPAA